MPKASIIIPVYNGSKSIQYCINSIKCQSFEDYECFIIDDGSTDNTFDVASNAIANDIRFHILQIKHEGLSNARNIGIKTSIAEIVFNVDADDEVSPEMLEHSIKFMKENDLELIFFDAIVNFNEPDFLLKESVQRYFNRKKCYGISSGKTMLGEMLANRDYVYSVFLQAIKRTAIRHYFHYGLRAQDILYTTQNLFLAQRVGHLSELLYVKNNGMDSVSNSRHDANYVWSLLTTFKEIQKFAESQDEHCFSLELVASYVFDSLIFGIRNLETEDWKTIKKMSFTDRTTLFNLRKNISKYKE